MALAIKFGLCLLVWPLVRSAPERWVALWGQISIALGISRSGCGAGTMPSPNGCLRLS
jgi:hypothetical protein